MKYKHHECSSCHNVWDSDDYMDKCPYCGSMGHINQSESNEREYDDYYYSEEK